MIEDDLTKTEIEKMIMWCSKHDGKPHISELKAKLEDMLELICQTKKE